jgi:hypothetical protein
MRRFLFAASLVFVATAALAASSKPPAELDAMRKAFATAVAAKDRVAMARMSAFPLTIDNYGSAPTLSQKDFLASKDYFDGWFFGGDEQVVDCIGKSGLQFESGKKEFGAGLWYVDCSGGTYFFRSRGGKWLFAAYQNVGE